MQNNKSNLNLGEQQNYNHFKKEKSSINSFIPSKFEFNQFTNNQFTPNEFRFNQKCSSNYNINSKNHDFKIYNFNPATINFNKDLNNSRREKINSFDNTFNNQEAKIMNPNNIKFAVKNITSL